MATLAAKSEQVAPLANSLAKSLCGDSTIAATDWTSPKIVSAMIQISNAEKLDSWDEAAQRYLASSPWPIRIAAPPAETKSSLRMRTSKAGWKRFAKTSTSAPPIAALPISTAKPSPPCANNSTTCVSIWNPSPLRGEVARGVINDALNVSPRRRRSTDSCVASPQSRLLLAQPPAAAPVETNANTLNADAKSASRASIFKSHAFSGWQNCHICHRLGDRGQPDDNQKLEIIVSMNESTIWSKDDKHALAARVLIPDENTQNLAFRMREIYGPQAWEQVQSQCRACHVAGERTTDHALGVTCEACHGPAKDYVQPHWEDRTTWRYLSPADKEKTGLVNLRDPVTKTETCLSCHLGSMAEGKLVTHDMYAAGHPPLPGFDTATFAAAMPIHWTPLHEKLDAKYKQTHAADHNFAPQTRDVLLAGSHVACLLSRVVGRLCRPARYRCRLAGIGPVRLLCLSPRSTEPKLATSARLWRQQTGSPAPALLAKPARTARTSASRRSPQSCTPSSAPSPARSTSSPLATERR